LPRRLAFGLPLQSMFDTLLRGDFSGKTANKWADLEFDRASVCVANCF